MQFLGGNDAAADSVVSTHLTREALKELARQDQRLSKGLVVIFGSELRGADVKSLIDLGLAQGAKFLCLGDYANSRGAADMGLYPDLLPGYAPVDSATKFHEKWVDAIPKAAGLNLLQMVDAAKAGTLKALYVVGSNPVARYNIDPFALSKTFVVVQDMFLTETATIADVVLPVANAYEKSGTYTNTAGDLQLLQEGRRLQRARAATSSASSASRRPWDTTCSKLVPFGGAGVRADMGQTRGAQSGESDQHAVWLAARNLEPKMSPFDPTAMLDEIQRLVPGYDVSRLSLVGRPGRTHATGADHGCDGERAS